MEITTETPELNKLKDARDQTMVAGEFIEWLQGQENYQICTPANDGLIEELEGEQGEQFTSIVKDFLFSPSHKSIEDLLSEWKGIDQKKCEEERQALLKEIQSSGV